MEVQATGADAARGGAWQATAWGDLAAPRAPGRYRIRWSIGAEPDTEGLEVPVCAGRGPIRLDGEPVAGTSPGPVVVGWARGSGAHTVTVEVTVSAYERRVACGAPARAGAVELTTDGLSEVTFTSPHAARGGGKAVLFVPPGHDAALPAPLLVGAHPWNGGPWTYAAYAELLAEATARDVVLVMPSGLGNSLYTAPAEDEVMRAIDAVAHVVAVDPQRVSIWGASMGGAGATTIGLHHPDRFASITSLFGDSRYDLSTYVRAILVDEAAAHRVNALDVVENARHVPVWLIHGEDDRVSPIVQSEQLARALEAHRFAVRFDRVPHAGHEGGLVARFARDIVARASEARAPVAPSRVTYRSVRAEDTGAYGVRLVRAGGASTDAFVDVELDADAVHVRRASGVRAVVLARGALGFRPSARRALPPIVVDAAAQGVRAAWEVPETAPAAAP